MMISDPFVRTEYLSTYQEQSKQLRRKRGKAMRLEKLPLTGRASCENKIIGNITNYYKKGKTPLLTPMASRSEEGPPR